MNPEEKINRIKFTESYRPKIRALLQEHDLVGSIAVNPSYKTFRLLYLRPKAGIKYDLKQLRATLENVMVAIKKLAHVKFTHLNPMNRCITVELDVKGAVVKPHGTLKPLNRGDRVRYIGKFKSLHGLEGEIVSVPGDIIEGIHEAGYSAKFKSGTYAVTPRTLKIIKRCPMKYEDKVKRWTLGTGEITYSTIPDSGPVKGIHIKETTCKIGGTFQGGSSVIRAMVSFLSGFKGYKVILYQGLGHTDTIKTVKRWVDVRNLVRGHLKRIDKYLERPLNKFQFPSLGDIFPILSTPVTPQPAKVGDLVVITSTDGVENRQGWLGIVKEKLPCNRYDLLVKNKNENGYLTTYHRDHFEIIDHDKDLLKEEEEELRAAKAGVRRQARELDCNITADSSIADCTRVISAKLNEKVPIKGCDPDKFPWPYNAKPSLLKKTIDCGPFWFKGQFVKIWVDAHNDSIKVRMECLGCAKVLKEIQL